MPALIDVTVVLLEHSLPSTALAPLEIFASTGVVWQMLRGEPAQPRFRVHAVSLDGKPTRHSVPIQLRP